MTTTLGPASHDEFAPSAGRCPLLPPAGPLGAALAELFSGDPNRSTTVPHSFTAALESIPRGAEMLTDLDAQRTWFVMAELHGRGVETVSDRWDDNPALAHARWLLAERLEEALHDRIGAVEPCSADELPERIRAELANCDAPPLSTYLLTSGTLENYRDLLRHRSAYHLREADPHTFAIPRLAGTAKAALLEIQADEYGGGNVRRMHSTLFAEAMAALDLNTSYGAYLADLPAVTLAWSNVMTLCALRQHLRAALVGHLVALECTSSIPNRRYGDGLRRLGGIEKATRFFDEHVEADAVHEQVAIYDMAVPLARAEPDQTVNILTGVRAALLLDGDVCRYLMNSWSADESNDAGGTTVTQ